MVEKLIVRFDPTDPPGGPGPDQTKCDVSPSFSLSHSFAHRVVVAWFEVPFLNHRATIAYESRATTACGAPPLR